MIITAAISEEKRKWLEEAGFTLYDVDKFPDKDNLKGVSFFVGISLEDALTPWLCPDCHRSMQWTMSDGLLTCKCDNCGTTVSIKKGSQVPGQGGI